MIGTLIVSPRSLKKGKKLGSGRKTSYTGEFTSWPKKGLRFSFKRNDSHKHLDFKTSSVKEVKYNPKKKDLRTFVTKHGTEYVLERKHEN